jgi:hypothetical protein
MLLSPLLQRNKETKKHAHTDARIFIEITVTRNSYRRKTGTAHNPWHLEANLYWEANSSSASYVFCLWHSKVHYRLHKSSSLDLILSQKYPVRISPLHYFEIHSNIILSSTPTSSKWSLPFRFSDLNVVWILQLNASSISLLTFGKEYRLWSYSLGSFLQFPIIPSVIRVNVKSSLCLTKYHAMKKCGRVEV